MPSAVAVGSGQLGEVLRVGKDSFKQRFPGSLDDLTTGSMVPVFNSVAPFP